MIIFDDVFSFHFNIGMGTLLPNKLCIYHLLIILILLINISDQASSCGGNGQSSCYGYIPENGIIISKFELELAFFMPKWVKSFFRCIIN